MHSLPLLYPMQQLGVLRALRILKTKEERVGESKISSSLQDGIKGSLLARVIGAGTDDTKVNQLSTMAIEEVESGSGGEGEDDGEGEDGIVEELDSEASARFLANTDKLLKSLPSMGGGVDNDTKTMLRKLKSLPSMGDGVDNDTKTMLRYGTMFVPLEEAEKVEDKEEQKKQQRVCSFEQIFPSTLTQKVSC